MQQTAYRFPIAVFRRQMNQPGAVAGGLRLHIGTAEEQVLDNEPVTAVDGVVPQSAALAFWGTTLLFREGLYCLGNNFICREQQV